MQTYLEDQWREDRNVNTLFPYLASVAQMNPVDAYKAVKENRTGDGDNLSETIDAAWWCMYGLLYSQENGASHQEYFSGDGNFKKDAETLCKCEAMRLESGTHRYPLPKKGNGKAAKRKQKRFNEYRDFVVQAVMAMAKGIPQVNDSVGVEGMYKMAIDMIRCSQERLIGKEPDDVNDTRKSQFTAICELLDDVFIHRGYSRKVSDEGAEMLTPEQVDEWESAKVRIQERTGTANALIPGFVRGMVNQAGFIGDVIA